MKPLCCYRCENTPQTPCTRLHLAERRITTKTFQKHNSPQSGNSIIFNYFLDRQHCPASDQILNISYTNIYFAFVLVVSCATSITYLRLYLCGTVTCAGLLLCFLEAGPAGAEGVGSVYHTVCFISTDAEVLMAFI